MATALERDPAYTSDSRKDLGRLRLICAKPVLPQDGYSRALRVEREAAAVFRCKLARAHGVVSMRRERNFATFAAFSAAKPWPINAPS